MRSLEGGYFEQTEVETVLSLLRVIDNPYQDIPLAGVLRSPIGGLDAEELAAIATSAPPEPVLRRGERGAATRGSRRRTSQVDVFLARLGRGGTSARQGSLTELIWQIYRETGYYDLVGGLPGGRAAAGEPAGAVRPGAAYEATSFRGLFRFLRFIDRMRDRAAISGRARALGEQEDVVRIMSIHKSKGLEFPVVFVGGTGEAVQWQDLQRAVPDAQRAWTPVPLRRSERRVSLSVAAVARDPP